ncbi:SAM-dependent methyltransferase [Dictyobacter formicarum]|uniref:Ribosomal RNA methyltransferase FtsJ domain-containing protein n=1 Tax=Dictyobacter formicarum TaxID=2778368 RepID=A0ABQ3VGG4_9CHLR|nr:SAM-dependent methyltransferase [Dictyobacter formicarum]GHO84870.1 hypothetical protein KSZ_28760 [Dictyobacter formicarum]
MNTTENLCLVTAQAEFTDAALAELQALDPSLSMEEEIAPGILLCRAQDAARFMAIASQTHPTFTRHIAPVQTIVPLENSENDLGEIALAIVQLPGFAQLERGVHFAVQTRLIQTDKSKGERAYSGGQINKALAEALAEETAAIEDVKKPQVVISLLATMDKGYLGISTVEENLSAWPGGARHYAQTDEQISRAEFKLLEALEVFGVILPTQGKALDLGAAPGGWTRLLLDEGLEVVAVDPAKLDPRLVGRQGLEHYRGYAEDYLEDAVQRRQHYDLIVNDMRMDAREAARLISKAAACLDPEEGLMISVFKLPHATLAVDPFVNLKEALNILKRSYAVVQAHQLFHNRQEVTVVAAQPLPQARAQQHSSRPSQTRNQPPQRAAAFQSRGPRARPAHTRGPQQRMFQPRGPQPAGNERDRGPQLGRPFRPGGPQPTRTEQSGGPRRPRTFQPRGTQPTGNERARGPQSRPYQPRGPQQRRPYQSGPPRPERHEH